MSNTSVELKDVKQNGARNKSPTLVEPGGNSRFPARVADPCIMVIFGASGDLATRKLLPAIYSLAKSRLLPNEFAVVGIARDHLSREDYQERMRACIHGPAGPSDVDSFWTDWLVSRLYYFAADAAQEERYRDLGELLLSLDQTWSTPGNYLFYLATAPSLFSIIGKHLGASRLAHQGPGKWRRVVIEKPFCHDLESAKNLNRQILQVLRGAQISRIDPYLAKTTLPNFLAL